MIKAHLQQDGILQIWYPASTGDKGTLAAIAKSLEQAFPYVRAFEAGDDRFGFSGILFLASKERIPVTSSSVLAARLPAAAAIDLVEWGPTITAQQLFDRLLSHESDVNKLAEEVPDTPALTDDRPINEYFLLRDRLHISR